MFIDKKELNFNWYLSFLNKMNTEKADQTTVAQKREKLLEVLLGDKSPFSVTNRETKYHDLTKHLITKIIKFRIGRKLLKAILCKKDSDQLIQIEFHDRRDNCLKISKHTIFLCVEMDSYYAGTKDGVDVELCMKPLEVGLFHELIHLLHLFLKSAKIHRLVKDGLLNPDLGTLEEQNTITGIVPYQEGYFINPLCENAFLYDLGLGLRINYKGFYLEKGGSLTLMHSLRVRAKSAYNSHSINQVYPDPQEPDEEKKITPLTYACRIQDKEMVNTLLKNGAKICASDFFKGAFLFCSAHGYDEMALCLIKHANRVKEPISMQKKLKQYAIQGKWTYKDLQEGSIKKQIYDFLDHASLQILFFQALDLKKNGWQFFYFLLVHYIDGSEQDSFGNTPLIYFLSHVMDNEQKMLPNPFVDILLKIFELKQLDYNTPNHRGETALLFALRMGDLSLIKMLLDKKVIIPETLMQEVEALSKDKRGLLERYVLTKTTPAIWRWYGL